MDYEFSRYDDENGRLCIEGLTVSFPMVSQRFFRGDGIAVEADVKMNRKLFVPSGYVIEDDGRKYRIWKLTKEGRALVKESKAA